MDVVFVASWFPSRMNPELGNFVQRHAEALAHTGTNVKVIHIVYSNRILFPKMEEKMLGGIEIIHFFLPKIGMKSTLLIRNWSKLLVKKIAETGATPSVMHSHVAHPAGDIAVAIADLLKIPMVYTEHWSGFDPARHQKISPDVKDQIERLVAKSSLVLPVSDYLGRLMIEAGFKSNYKVVNNAVDTRYFYSLPRKQGSPFTFLHISNFAPGIKNTEGIFNAFSKIRNPDCQLIVAGDGNLDRLKQYCQAEDIDTRRIHFYGKQSYEEVARLNQQSDCFVLFSNFETSSCVIAEALCCGLPIISSNVGGVPEMVNGTNGILVKPGNVRNLTEAMDQIIENRDTYNSSEIAKKAQERFGYNTIGNAFLDIYRSVIDQR